MEKLTERLRTQEVPHTLRVGIDGPDAAGKTTLADDLARRLGVDREVIRIGADDFLHPVEIRHRRGRMSAEGYYLDAFDHEAMTERVLRPLGPDGDGTYQLAGESRQAKPGAILLFDGVFLLRPELRDQWDVSIYLHAEPDETLRRALERDVERMGSPEVVRRGYRTRYLPAQSMYRMIASPRDRATIVLDMADPTCPRITRWSE